MNAATDVLAQAVATDLSTEMPTELLRTIHRVRCGTEHISALSRQLVSNYEDLEYGRTALYLLTEALKTVDMNIIYAQLDVADYPNCLADWGDA